MPFDSVRLSVKFFGFPQYDFNPCEILSLVTSLLLLPFSFAEIFCFVSSLGYFDCLLYCAVVGCVLIVLTVLSITLNHLSINSSIPLKVALEGKKVKENMKGMVGLLLKLKKIGKKYGSLYGTTQKTPPPPTEIRFFRVIYQTQQWGCFSYLPYLRWNWGRLQYRKDKIEVRHCSDACGEGKSLRKIIEIF